jgi:3-hydroxybutyryl-CoA dehydrogenase
VSIERVGIVGSGTIACGLAVTVAGYGDVIMWARSDASAERAERRLAELRTKMGDGAGPRPVGVRTGFEDIEDRTFIVEAVAEDMDAKRDVLSTVATRMGDGAVLATTTSSLSVSHLAQVSGRPERFVGLHVFNPVPRMRLVELAFPDRATEDTRARTHALCTSIDKEPVEVPDTAGFVVNRLLFPYLFDAARFAVESGLPAAHVDTCMTLGAGYPMGPLALLDYVGLDVAEAIGDALGVEVPETIRLLVADGALGRKAGRGLCAHLDGHSPLEAASNVAVA